MSIITLLKGLLLRFFSKEIEQKVLYFLDFIEFVSWTTKLNSLALSPTFQCAGKDGNASGFSKYFNLSREETALV